MGDDGIIVIGAGVGGLTAAMLLAAHGHAVTVLEADSTIGGKIKAVTVAGREIDTGPTVLTMLPVFEGLFAACGQSLTGAVGLRRASLLARHWWSVGERLDLHADRQQSADAIGYFAGASAARGYLAFCAHVKRIYETMDRLFMQADKPSPLGMVRHAGLSGLKDLIASAPFTSLWESLGTYFPDPRLRQLYGRYATYCGSSPFAAPATLALIAHVEQDGVWLVDGGIRAFASALGNAATTAGAILKTNTAVASILVEQGRAAGVRLATGDELRARAVIANCDVGALASGLLGADARRAVAKDATAPLSLSAATWAVVAEADDFPLAHHSVFFSRSSLREFDDLFQHQRTADDPTVYVCAQDRSSRGEAPSGMERLFIIVNAPADGGRALATADARNRCKMAMLRTVERCGMRLRIEAETHLGPHQFSQRFPGTNGAIYGMATHGWTSSFRRQGTRSRIPGLYLAGGSVHPGAGLPMAALSGQAAARNVMAHLAST